MVAILTLFDECHKEVSLKGVKGKTWDLTSKTFRSNDAEPTNRKLTNYSNS